MVRRGFLQVLRLIGRMQKGRKPATIAQFGDSPSILLLRQDRFGDVMMSSFILTALREKYPKSKIGILLGKNNAGAEPLLPIDCEVYVYRKHLGRDLKTIREIVAKGYEIVIDLTDKASVTSSLLIAAIGAQVNVGVEKENALMYDITVPKYAQSAMHITERIAELLRPFGIDPSKTDLRPKLNLAVARIKSRVGFNVSSRTGDRSAPPKASAEIAKGVLAMGFHEVMIFAAPHDKQRGIEVAHLASDSRIHMAEGTGSFVGFAEQIASCEYLITVDTSTIQIAAAAGIPMVLIFKPMPDEHPWTPVGVPFEIHTQHPNLSALEPQPVLELFKHLVERSATSAHLLESEHAPHTL